MGTIATIIIIMLLVQEFPWVIPVLFGLAILCIPLMFIISYNSWGDSMVTYKKSPTKIVYIETPVKKTKPHKTGPSRKEIKRMRKAIEREEEERWEDMMMYAIAMSDD